MLFGARQTGKSTLLVHLLPAPALHYNLADPEERSRLLADPGVFRRECEALPGGSDESQRARILATRPEGDVVPLEVKWTARPVPQDARHVEEFNVNTPRRARVSWSAAVPADAPDSPRHGHSMVRAAGGGYWLDVLRKARKCAGRSDLAWPSNP